MISTREFHGRVTAFCERFGLPRTEFGRLAGVDRDFVRDLELGRVGLRRINKAHEFMDRIESDPGALEEVRRAAQGPGAVAVVLEDSEAGEGPRKRENSGRHARSLAAGGARRHREAFP